MKKYLFFALPAVALLFGACNREHQCKCTYDAVENDQLFKVFVVDGSISCEDIVMMGYEEHIATEQGQSLRRVDTLRLTCRDFGE